LLGVPTFAGLHRMTSDASWQNARVWRMRVAENRVLADDGRTPA